MITTAGKAAFCKAMRSIVSRAECTIDGRVVNLPIHSVTVDGDVFKVNVYLDDTVEGTVTATRLYSYEGAQLINRADSVRKINSKSLLIVFELQLSEVER